MVFGCPALQSVQDQPCLPCLGLPNIPWSCSRGSVKVWGWRTASWIAFMYWVPFLVILMMHQPHLYQPWRLDMCHSFVHPFVLSGRRAPRRSGTRHPPRETRPTGATPPAGSE